MTMIYTLKQYDISLLRFSASVDSADPEIAVLWLNEEQKNLLPMDLKPEAASLEKWLKRRSIPRNRAYVHNLLAKCGLNLNRPMSIISVCKGLSLNDCYWVTEENDTSTFAENNLYDNSFSQVLAALAFTGYGSSVRSSLFSTPEFTTNGMLPKCWRRVNREIRLYKGGTTGASNTGNEPYSEYYAYQIAQMMGLNAVPYQLAKWKGQLCSHCKLFTSKEISYLPVGRVVTSGGMKAVRAYYEALGTDFVDALNDMLVFDAIICNVDRHFGNFGFLIDNHTNAIVAPAPLFDHGNSLFNFAGDDCWESEKELDDYIETLMPSVYDDFIGTAKGCMNSRQRACVLHLMNFKFHRHPRYNLSIKRLRAIEKQVQKRAKLLI